MDEEEQGRNALCRIPSPSSSSSRPILLPGASGVISQADDEYCGDPCDWQLQRVCH